MSNYGQIYGPLYSGIYRGLYEGREADPLVFHALTPDPVTFELKNVLAGIGDLTEARTGSLYQADHENIWREFKTTIPAIFGGRVVENDHTHSNNIADVSWAAENGCLKVGAVTGIGLSGEDVMELSFTTNTNGRLQQTLTLTGDNFIESLWVRTVTGTTTVRLLAAGSFSGNIAVTTTWQRITDDHAITLVASAKRCGINNNSGGNTANIYICKVQHENATGRSSTTIPSNYIATTTAAVQKVYANVNGNSVASNVVTEATGAALASDPWLVGVPAHTNQITQSYDLADAAWTETGTSVAALDAVGLRGDANGATTLTDDNSGAFENVTETVSVAANTDTHIARFFILKDTDETRFPELELRMGAGATNLAAIQINTKTGVLVEASNSIGTFSSEINQTGNWWELLISVSNTASESSARIDIFPAATTVIDSADASATGSIIVGNVELHLNTDIDSVRGASPIFTAGATGSTVANDDSFDDANHTAEQGGYFIEWQPQYATSEVSGNIEILSLNNSAGLLYYDATNSLLKSTDGTNTATVALTIVSGTTYKVWVAYGGTSLQVGVDASTGTEGTFDGAFATGTKIEAITPSNNTTLVRNIRHYNSGFAASVTTLQALAA